VRHLDRTPPATRATSIILVIVGVALMLLSIFADTIGFGGGKGFGYQQLIVLIVGLVLTLGGIAIIIPPLTNRD